MGQIMAADGAEVTPLSHVDLPPTRFAALNAIETDCIVLNFLDSNPSRASLLHIRRLKRASPHLRVGVVLWQMPAELIAGDDPATRILPVSAEKRREAEAIGADFVVTDAEAAMAAVFSKAAPLPLPEGRAKPVRAKRRLRVQTV